MIAPVSRRRPAGWRRFASGVCIALAWSSAAPLFGQDAPASDRPEPAAEAAGEAPAGDTQVQADMPRGPAEIFKRRQEREDAPRGSALPAGHPPVATPSGAGESGTSEGAATGTGSGTPVGNDPHAGLADAPPLGRRQIATAQPSSALPAGTIRVRVVDSQTERPVAGAQIQLGTMTRENTRESEDAKTGSNGEYVFEKLATGDGQAYRVNVLHEGAKYSSTPFRLPYDHGYDVLIRQLPTTRDARELVLYVGATSIELRDERLRVVQQARLVNIGAKTYVFPEGGQLVELPSDFTAFQTEEVMTDQQLREVSGEGFKLSGSIPPGEITLTWGFDIPYSSTEVDLSFDLPWVTFAYRVLADAAPGMTIEVEEMPTPELREENGRRFWVTELVKRVGEQPLRTVTIHVRGIPGPGPMRIIATVAAVLVLIAGVWIARRPPPAQAAGPVRQDFEQRKAALVARAAALGAERERGEIGPEFHAEQLAEIEEELATLLYEQSQGQQQASKSQAA